MFFLAWEPNDPLHAVSSVSENCSKSAHASSHILCRVSTLLTRFVSCAGHGLLPRWSPLVLAGNWAASAVKLLSCTCSWQFTCRGSFISVLSPAHPGCGWLWFRDCTTTHNVNDRSDGICKQQNFMTKGRSFLEFYYLIVRFNIHTAYFRFTRHRLMSDSLDIQQ